MGYSYLKVDKCINFSLQEEIPGINWSDYLKNLVSADLWTKINDNGEALVWVDAPDYYNSVSLHEFQT